MPGLASPIASSTRGSTRVVELPNRISLDRLRRENYRYPDHDLANRLVEVATERPPLFGSDF